MTDQPEPKAETNWWKWGLVGLGVASAATAGAVIGSGQQEALWPEDRAPQIASAQSAQTLALAPVEEPSAEASSLIRGVINPSSESTIASRMTARIVAMPYGEGQAFPAGALLAKFDCSQIQAELNAAQAATAAYKKTYETNVELDQYEAIGKNDLAVSKANLGKATAEATAVSTQLSDCEIRAPFAGKVVEQIAHNREVAASGQPLLKIQSGREVEMELIVPSNWLTWLKPGASFAFKIDETGNEIRGTVKRFGASVDPVSKTIRVTGVVTARNGLVLPGMSGTATFDDPRAGTAVLPPATAAARGADGKPS